MIISVDTTLEQMLEYTSTLRCNRGLDCCRRPGIMLEDDVKRLNRYMWEKEGILPREVADKYLDPTFTYGERFYMPKTVGDMCIFLGVEERAEQNPGRRVIDRIRDIRSNGCRQALPSNLMTFCMIQDAKPLIGRLMNCVQGERTDLWFNYIMIAQRSKKALDQFMKEYRRAKYVFLPGLG